MRHTLLGLAIALLFAGGAVAADIKSVMAANGCNNCHALSEQIVGPSFDAVGQKYRGQTGALALLERKVRSGGAGVWGQVAMPPNPQISDADLRWLLTEILARQQGPAKRP